MDLKDNFADPEKEEAHAEEDDEKNKFTFDLAKKYKLDRFELEKKIPFKDPLFAENVKGGWINKEMFLEQVRKKGRFGSPTNKNK